MARADDLGFPTSIGPFTMARANLSEAFNAFYRQNPEFPKPSATNDDNSMIGMDPMTAGMGAGDMVFCQISPLHRITLASEAKAAVGIPEAASAFAWAYPLVLEPGQRKPTGAAEAAFGEFGGYMYFNDQQNVVGTNSISPASIGTEGLMFGRSQILPPDVAETMTKQGRFQEITLQVLSDKGATHFGWIRPREFARQVASADGCFAYRFANGNLRYFPVVSEAIFTMALLQEELDESEAWVVVRDGSAPAVERAVIFDRTKTLDENLQSNSQVSTFQSMAISRDSNPTQMTYEDWQSSSDSGTIADPWILQLRNS